tara:strand:+ start:161 stop:502 length:342 start_codon:yes stop_codon:yes gene_type:complete
LNFFLKKKAKKKFLKRKSINNKIKALVILLSPKKFNSKKLKSMTEFVEVFSNMDENNGIIAAILKNSSGMIIREIRKILTAFFFKLRSKLLKMLFIFLIICKLLKISQIKYLY